MARAAYTGVSTVDSAGQPLGQVFDIPYDATRLRVQNLMPIHAVMFCLSAVRDACRFDESLELYEDWDFWVQVSKLAPMAHLPGVSAVYRIHESSGVHKADGPAQAVASELFRRWRADVTEDEFSGLINRVRATDALLVRAERSAAEVASLRAELHSTQAALQGSAERSAAEVASLRAELHSTQAALQGSAERSAAEVASLRAELQSERAVLAGMSNSMSWRVTAPLRRLSRLTGLGLLCRDLMRLLAKVLLIKGLEGWAGVWRRVAKRFGPRLLDDSLGYQAWLGSYATLTREGAESLRADAEGLAYRPTISVVMPVYNPPLKYLRAAVESVRAQAYTRWELCVCDDASSDPDVLAYLQTLPALDPRIKTKLRSTNGHISATSNDALAMSEGEWVALLDHDDLLAVDALYWVVKTLQSHADAGVIYSDEDKIGLDGKRCDPYFKPDWSPELVLSQNYISHLGVYRRGLLESVGGFRLGLEGSQDHDLLLRCVLRLEPHQIVHIPRVLYHWRVLPGSTALAGNEKSYAADAGVRAVSDYLVASGLGGKVVPLENGYYRVVPSMPDEQPWVSLVVPTRNAHELVRKCLQSILEKTTYSNYDILLVDNGSDEPASLAYFEEASKHPRVQVIRDSRDFNFSALNNAAVSLARGEIIGLVNNDIEVITPNWLQEMVGLALRPGVGAVGARLWYPDDTLQHGGVVMGAGGVAGHAHLGRVRGDGGYFGRAEITQNYLAVTAACLVVRKASYLQVGGLNEEQLKVAFNDVDFCLRLVEAGLRNVWTPFAEMYHHESATRGSEDTSVKRARFESEVRYMTERWGHVLQHDPTYSPNLSLADGQFSLAFPPRVVPSGL
jgi:glycosyltransferase involved in cell wall biosynthesis